VQATYAAAVKRWLAARTILRQGARVVRDSGSQRATLIGRSHGAAPHNSTQQ